MPKQTKEQRYGCPTCSEATIWRNMWYRCVIPTDKRFKDYGGRGIRVCERWRDFFSFMEDMGRRPSPEHSLDRINVNGDYCPENCRWATREEQANNQRSNIRITLDGETRTLSQWARMFGVDRQTAKRRHAEHGDWQRAFREAKRNLNTERVIKITVDGETRTLNGWAKKYGVSAKVIWQRINRDGMTPEQAVKTECIPQSDRNFNRQDIEIGGETKGFNQWCKHFKISSSTVWKRLRKGWDIEQALRTPPDKSLSRVRDQ